MRNSIRLAGVFAAGIVAGKRVFGRSQELTLNGPQPLVLERVGEPAALADRLADDAGRIADADRSEGSTVNHLGESTSATVLGQAPKLAWQVVLFMTVVIGAVAIWLLPSDLERPSLVPVDHGAVANHSRVYLVSLSGDESSRADLDWSSNSDDDVDFLAAVQGPESPGALIFAGPIARALRGCSVNAESVDPEPGLPGPEFARVLTREALDAYPSENVAHISLRVAQGAASPFILCDFADGFSSKEPPTHWVYTPELTILVGGLPDGLAATNGNICAQRSVADDSADEVCAQGSGRAYIGDQLVELQRPREQWRRDTKLAVLGLMLGLVAQGVWDLVSRVRRLQQA